MREDFRIYSGIRGKHSAQHQPRRSAAPRNRGAARIPIFGIYSGFDGVLPQHEAARRTGSCEFDMNLKTEVQLATKNTEGADRTTCGAKGCGKSITGWMSGSLYDFIHTSPSLCVLCALGGHSNCSFPDEGGCWHAPIPPIPQSATQNLRFPGRARLRRALIRSTIFLHPEASLRSYRGPRRKLSKNRGSREKPPHSGIRDPHFDTGIPPQQGCGQSAGLLRR